MSSSVHWCLLMFAAVLGAGRAAPGGGTVYKPATTTTITTVAPADQKEAGSNAKLASEIVDQLQSLAHHHHLPGGLYDVPSDIPYGPPLYDPYEHNYVKLHESEVAPDPAQVTPSGFNVKGVLGLVEYLILLILLKGSISHIAERSARSSIRRERRRVEASGGDLVGVAAQMREDPGISTPGTWRTHAGDDSGSARRRKYTSIRRTK